MAEAELPTFNIPEDEDSFDWGEVFDGRQIDRAVIGVNRGVDGFKQAFEEMKETLGLVPEGSSAYLTQELKKDQEILREAATRAEGLSGGVAYEFLGETIPLFAIGAGSTIPRAMALGGLAGSGFFQEDVDESRIDDIALGAGLGGLFRTLIRGGRARKQVEDEIKKAERGLFLGPPDPKALIGPLKSPGRALVPITGSRALVPSTGGRALVPSRASGPRLSPDDFQNAGRGTALTDAMASRAGVPSNRALVPTQTRAQTRARQAIENAKRGGGGVLDDVAHRTAISRVSSFAKAQRAKADRLQRHIDRLIEKGIRPANSLQRKLTSALYNEITADVLAKAINGKLQREALGRVQSVPTSKALVPTPKQAPARPIPRERGPILLGQDAGPSPNFQSDRILQDTIENGTKKDLITLLKQRDPTAKNLSRMTKDQLAKKLGETAKGGRQAGFFQSDMANLVAGAGIGGMIGGTIGEGDPLAIGLGALTGGIAARGAGRFFDRVTTNKQREAMRRASEEGGNFNEKVSRAMKAKDWSGEQISSVFQGARQVLEEFMGSTMYRLEQIAPRVAVALKNAEFQQHYVSGQWIGQGNDLFSRIEAAGLTDAQKEAYKIHLLNSTDRAKGYLRSIGKEDAAQAVGELETILAQAGDYLKGVDLGENLRRNYFPRTVKDLSAFPKAIQQEVNTYLDQLAKKKHGVKLTDFEKEIAIAEVINGALTRGPGQAHFGRAADQLQRRTNKVDRTNVAAYADPHEAFNDYVEQITTQVERRRFFKNLGVKVDDLGPNAENIESVAQRLANQLKKGELDPDQVDEAARLIRMRFGPGEQAPHKAWQNFKNLTYTGLLGNPLAAATQFGDLALSAHRNGIINTARAVVSGLSTRGKLGRIDKEQLTGIRNAAADFASRTSTRDLLNWSLKYSGFQAVDRLGKNTYMRAAMMKNQQLSQDAFRTKWKHIFDPDAQGNASPRTDALYQKVKNFEDITPENREDIAFMLWNELQEAQPIALSALPERYLQHPNGRTAYMLQSFTLKLFDVMRRDILDHARRGNYKQATQNAVRLSSLFVVNNSTVDAAKNFLMNKDATVPEVVVNNYLRMLGVNKFMVDQVGREGLGSTLLKTIAPPTVIGDAITDPREALKLFPIGGKLMESRIPE